ncbi:MAG: hydrogenase maturation nickel metallochaperone HypA [Desulfobulbaceae bacterium]|jgi:hydrogenase nickel incorporation protein HypA/HybF|nr:hydrogenase maturation nickel metallochaperone HypA [Desulfobulbaceae bacterium]
MHELSLVAALIEQLDALINQHGAARLSRVRLTVGPFSGVCAESLQFAYRALAADNPRYADSCLETETPPGRFLCAACGHESEHRPETCPRCGGTIFDRHGGRDLILQQVELEEE